MLSYSVVRSRSVGVVLPGTTESHVITEREILLETPTLGPGIVAREDEAVPGVEPDPHAVLHTGGLAVSRPPAAPPGPLDGNTLTFPAPVGSLPSTAGALQRRPSLHHLLAVTALERLADGGVLLSRPGTLQTFEEEPALLLRGEEIARDAVSLVVIPHGGRARPVLQALQSEKRGEVSCEFSLLSFSLHLLASCLIALKLCLTAG